MDFWLIIFSFSILNIPAYCLLASEVSDENYTDILIEGLLYVMSHFSLIAFKSLFLSLSFDSLITVCLSVGNLELILLGVC
jgi:hypothetical protein